MSDRVTRSSSRLQSKTRSVSQPPVDKTKGRASQKPSTLETPRPSRVRSNKFKQDQTEFENSEKTTTIPNVQQRVTRSRVKIDSTPLPVKNVSDEEDEIPLMDDIIPLQVPEKNRKKTSTQQLPPPLSPFNETPSKKSKSTQIMTPSTKTPLVHNETSVTPKKHSNSAFAIPQAGNSSDSDSDDAPEEVSGHVARQEAIGQVQSEQRGRKLATEKKKEVNRLRTQQQQNEAQQRKKKTSKKETDVDRLPQELLAELMAEVNAEEEKKRKKNPKQLQIPTFGSDLGEDDYDDGFFGENLDDDDDDDDDSEDNINLPYPSISKGPVSVLSFDRMSGKNPSMDKARRLQLKLDKHNARGRNRQPSRTVISKGRPGADFLKRDFAETSVRLPVRSKKSRNQKKQRRG